MWIKIQDKDSGPCASWVPSATEPFPGPAIRSSFLGSDPIAEVSGNSFCSDMSTWTTSTHSRHPSTRASSDPLSLVHGVSFQSPCDCEYQATSSSWKVSTCPISCFIPPTPTNWPELRIQLKGRAFSLHAANPGSVPGTPYGPQTCQE